MLKLHHEYLTMAPLLFRALNSSPLFFTLFLIVVPGTPMSLTRLARLTRNIIMPHFKSRLCSHPTPYRSLLLSSSTLECCFDSGKVSPVPVPLPGAQSEERNASLGWSLWLWGYLRFVGYRYRWDLIDYWLMQRLIIDWLSITYWFQVVLLLKSLKLYEITDLSVAIQITAHVLGYMNSCVNPLVRSNILTLIDYWLLILFIDILRAIGKLP